MKSSLLLDKLVERGLLDPDAVKKVISVCPDDTLQTASKLFWRHGVHRLLVLDQGRLVGVVTPMDLLLKVDLP